MRFVDGFDRISFEEIGDYVSVKIDDVYYDEHLSYPLTVSEAAKLVIFLESFINKHLTATEKPVTL